MNGFLTSFCFDLGSVSGAEIVRIIERGVGFEPTLVRGNIFSGSPRALDGKAWKKIAASKEVLTLSLETEVESAGPSFQVATLSSWGMQVIYFELPLLTPLPTDLLDSLTSISGFNAGYRHHAGDTFWQSETSVTTYEAFSKPHDHLPKVPDETFGGDKIDISNNPGRRSLFPGMWLQAAWQMWFGDGAFKYLPRERLVKFPHAYEIRRLDSGAIFVQLYPNGHDFSLPDSRRRQQEFRDWMGMDELEDQAKEFAVGKGDPTFDITEGSFPNEGVRLLTLWLDERDNMVRRSLASKKAEISMNSKGQEVWRKETLLADK